jgi:hypothetical protein
MTKETKKTQQKATPSTVKTKKTAAYDEAMADAFIMEVDDEVKNDNLKAFWKKYGLFIVLFVILVLSITVSFETIKNWRENQFRKQTDTYIAANLDQNPQQMMAALEKIAAGDHGIYSELARIQISDLLLEQNKIDDALKMLQSIVDNDELNPRIRNLAAIKLAAQKIDTAPFAEIETLLKPVVAADDSWAPIAKEYMALSAIQSGDHETARNLYQELLQDSRISDDFRNRVQDMLTALSDI